MSTNKSPKNISTTCFEERQKDKKEAIIPSFLQGFPGPQGLVGVPGEKVRRLFLAFFAPVFEKLRVNFPTFIQQGPQGKKGALGLPGNDGPPVSVCFCVG